MRAREADHGRCAAHRAHPTRGSDADGRVRVERIAGSRVHVGDGREYLIIVHVRRFHDGAGLCHDLRRWVERARRLKVLHHLRHLCGVVASHVEEKALKVGGDPDVHRGRERHGDAILVERVVAAM